jgi:hypothetical protein
VEHTQILWSECIEYCDKKHRHEDGRSEQRRKIPPGFVRKKYVAEERKENETAGGDRSGGCDENVNAINATCAREHRHSLKTIADETREASGRPEPERAAYSSERITELILAQAKRGSQQVGERLENVKHSDARIEIRRNCQDRYKQDTADGDRNCELGGSTSSG